MYVFPQLKKNTTNQALASMEGLSVSCVPKQSSALKEVSWLLLMWDSFVEIGKLLF